MSNNSWSKAKKNKNNRGKQGPYHKQKNAAAAAKKHAKEAYFSMDVGNVEHIDKRRVFNADAGIRPEAIHLYGCDFMSSVDVVEIFAPHVKKLEWIDDSNVNLLCHDAESAAEVLAAAVEKTDPSDGLWRRKDASYVDSVDGAQRHVRLEIRPCTHADVKDPDRCVEDSTYYRWNSARTLEENEKKRQKKGESKKGNMPAPISAVMDPLLPFGLTNSLTRALNNGSDNSNSISGGILADAGTGKGGSKGSNESSKGKGRGQGSDFGAWLEQQEHASDPMTSIGASTSSLTRQDSKKRRLSTQSDAASLHSHRNPNHKFSKYLPRCPLAPVNRAIGALRSNDETKDMRIKIVKVVKPYGSMIHARRKKDEAAKKRGEEVPKSAVGSLWTEWIQVNNFPEDVLLTHCLMFRKIVRNAHGEADKKKCQNFLVIVPHPLMVDISQVASAMGVKQEDLKKVSVKECHNMSGFPIFVCPPIGHEYSIPLKERMALEKKREEEKLKEEEKKKAVDSSGDNSVNVDTPKTDDSKISEDQVDDSRIDDTSSQPSSMDVDTTTPAATPKKEFSFSTSVSLGSSAKINEFGDKKDPIFVIFDASLIDCERPLLFDCGQSALIFGSAADMVRATNGSAIEGLATSGAPFKP